MALSADEQLAAEQAIPQVEIFLGGKLRTLSCTMYVLLKYQQETGENPFQINSSELSPKQMVAFLWAAVQQDEPDVTIEEVSKWMVGAHLNKVTQIIHKLFKISSPKPAESDDKPSSEESSKKN